MHFYPTTAPRLPGAREFARSRRVLLLTTSTGTDIDISLGAIQFEEMMIERTSSFAFAPGVELRTRSAEDLVVM